MKKAKFLILILSVLSFPAFSDISVDGVSKDTLRDDLGGGVNFDGYPLIETKLNYQFDERTNTPLVTVVVEMVWLTTRLDQEGLTTTEKDVRAKASLKFLNYQDAEKFRELIVDQTTAVGDDDELSISIDSTTGSFKIEHSF